MILRYGPNTTVDDDLGFGSSSTKSLSKVGGATGLVDGWGNPFVFCRWPVGANGTFFSPVNTSGPMPFTNGLSQDPLDPKGWLTGSDTRANNWLTGAPAAKFQALCHPLPPRGAGNKPQSINLTPVIVSSGPDGVLGLSFDPRDPNFPGCPFTDLTKPGTISNSTDNIYSTYIK